MISEDLKILKQAQEFVKSLEDYIDIQRIRIRNPTISEEEYDNLFDASAKRYADARIKLRDELTSVF